MLQEQCAAVGGKLVEVRYNAKVLGHLWNKDSLEAQAK